jgi:hypothetical protein
MLEMSDRFAGKIIYDERTELLKWFIGDSQITTLCRTCNTNNYFFFIILFKTANILVLVCVK